MLSVLLPVVKPELKTEFLKVWKKWFVTEDTVEDEKCPGKLKSETLSTIFYLFKFISRMGNTEWYICCIGQQNVSRF